MIKINLLDWRAARRERNKRGFFASLVAAFIIGIVIVYICNHAVASAINHQDARNNYLKQQIHVAETKIKKIKNIKKVRQRLAKHIKIIEGLQKSRTQVVHFFDSLAKTLPDGIYVTHIKESSDNKTTTIDGIADSNGAVANYLRNLDQSQWFTDPNLLLLSTIGKSKDSTRNSTFTLQAKNTTPAESDKKEASKGSTGHGRQS